MLTYIGKLAEVSYGSVDIHILHSSLMKCMSIGYLTDMPCYLSRILDICNARQEQVKVSCQLRFAATILGAVLPNQHS